MRRLLSILSLMLASACVTTSSSQLYRDDMSDAEWGAWRRQIDMEKRRVSVELAAPRKTLLARRATPPQLWRVSKDGKTSYLFGSIHTDIAWSSFPLSVNQCLSRATTAAFEADLAAPSFTPDISVASNTRTDFARHAGSKAWSRYLQEMLPINRARLHDLTTTSAVSLYLQVKDLAIRGQQPSMDAEAQFEAKKQKKHMLYLDTDNSLNDAFVALISTGKLTSMEEFRHAFEGDPFLLYKDYLAQLYKIVLAYKTGDFAALTDTSHGADPKFYDALIRKRNLLWLDRLDAAFSRTPTFVMVGVGHMAGDAALDKLLVKRGYTVSKVQSCEE